MNYFWNKTDGTWGTAGNWDKGTVPTSEDYVFINNGGTANINSGTAALGYNIYIGRNTGDGTVKVDGTGSQLNATNSLYVGYEGTGTLDITGGATAEADNISIGRYNGSSGNSAVTVNGQNSQLKATYNLYVGYSGTGTLDITDGATATTNYISIGSNSTGNGTVTVNGTGSQLIATYLSVGYEGTGTLNITGGATATTNDIWIRTNNGTSASGGTGSLTVSGTGTLNNGAYAGNIANFGTLTFDQSVDQTLSGTISGTGSLTKSGTGSLTLSGTNTYSGDTTITGGTLSIASDNNIGSGTNTLSGGTLELTGATTYAKGWTLGPGGGTISNAVNAILSGAISGTGSLTKSGAGSLTLSGTNTYSGGTTITGGTLQIGDGGSTGSITGNVAVASGASLAFNRNDNLTYSGVISGDGSLTKSGTGSLTLSGTNTYTGMTTVADGTLVLDSNLASSSGLTMLQGTTFDTNGHNHDLAGKTLTMLGNATYNGNLSALGATIIIGGSGNSISGNLAAPVTVGSLSFVMDDANTTVPMLDAGGQLQTTEATTTTLSAGKALTQFAAGNEVKLVSGLGSGSAYTAQTGVAATYGATDYLFDVGLDDADTLMATFTGARVVNNEAARGYGYGVSARSVALNNAYDNTLNVVDNWRMAGVKGLSPGAVRVDSFAQLSASHTRTRTGSHVDNDGFSFAAGAGWVLPVSDGSLLLGLFAEGGMGSYDSYNSYARGDGDTWHYGAGGFAKYKLDRGTYFEGSVRTGRTKSDLDGRGLDDYGYDSTSWYWGAHAGIGQEWMVSKTGMVDTYLKAIWTRTDSDSVTTKAGERLHFDSVDSIRSRLGARYVHTTESGLKAYAGAAWEYEFDGEVRSSLHGQRIDGTNELEGHSGLVEAGLEWNAAKAWTMNAKVEGLIGRREGVSGMFMANYRF